MRSCRVSAPLSSWNLEVGNFRSKLVWGLGSCLYRVFFGEYIKVKRDQNDPGWRDLKRQGSSWNKITMEEFAKGLPGCLQGYSHVAPKTGPFGIRPRTLWKGESPRKM
ncbi:hypothetical protein I7I51_03569 [Histoplasma capsulatum]|uniref:Uncharacterized protein n=1 Tax=Ajellomyces capsulatus TaxID=5037 RepID=A0A8A1M6S8_AJECA|nr:hypothetical protein I7I51_03569 [Histoplasma capsulatum]